MAPGNLSLSVKVLQSCSVCLSVARHLPLGAVVRWWLGQLLMRTHFWAWRHLSKTFYPSSPTYVKTLTGRFGKKSVANCPLSASTSQPKSATSISTQNWLSWSMMKKEKLLSWRSKPLVRWSNFFWKMIKIIRRCITSETKKLCANSWTNSLRKCWRRRNLLARRTSAGFCLSIASGLQLWLTYQKMNSYSRRFWVW